MERDRRMILVVHGDKDSNTLTLWMETPCDDHGQHFLRKRLYSLPGLPEDNPHFWMQKVLDQAREELCLCDAEPSDVRDITDILEALNGR